MTWTQKILRVNLTTGEIRTEPLNMAWAHQFLGQRGLATKYLVEEIDPTLDPLSPANKLIIATGPLTGTAAATGGRWSVITKGPLTGAIACSNSGGFFGAELKFAGWDMVILEGRAEKPVYLLIENEVATLLDASHLWGRTVWETEETLKHHHQDPQMRVASIGRAGENQVLFAAIVNDLHRAAGRSGVGAVMGSKNLKAIAVRGTVTDAYRPADPEGFAKAVADAKAVLAANGVTGQGLPTYGTQVLMNVINEVGALPTRNHRDIQFEGANAISGEAMHEKRPTDGKANLVTNAACFGCTIACGRISKLDPGHFTVKDKPQYHGCSGGVEYEAAWALGAANGVSDLEALTYVNFLCNEQGMDPITLGATIGAAMELYDLGILTKEEAGLELPTGSVEAMVKLSELCAAGEGFGRIIGLGSRRLCAKYGRPDLSMSVKGQEFPAYDGRGLQGMALEYATSNRGACHVRGYMVSPEVLGIPMKMDPCTTEGKAPMLKTFQDLTAVVDSAGICLFTTFAWGGPDIQSMIQPALGGDWSLDRLMELGERVWNLERRFNLAAGLTGKDDTLPPRLLNEPAKAGPMKGRVAELGKMLPEYYEVRGWTAEGVPTAATVQRLGL
ncbi:aldehyde ferredoxin oxidoreductase family protein [Mesoterricola sediminis]|uniref:Aldehyde ferredoxin oxidoreductase n=1 Tax=Mesoterricola sediminis TaxID=2927980 RepID=A0AA48GS41_9BACT|nr:aldehyde ferredoxin oxidoreductase family protein [Mesoterricola sediminis]BDU75149.1 aldehyde ferredoxin oxidoreductase [Mesoterricola sediminis]